MKTEVGRTRITGGKDATRRGATSLSILIVIVFLSLVTVGLVSSMSKIGSAKLEAIHRDAAVQLANGVIEKARSAKWSELGFVNGATPAPGTENYCRTDVKLNGSTGFRASDSNGQPTVINQGAANAAISPNSSQVVRDQTYCIRTDVTWKNPPEAIPGMAVLPSAGYGTKTITATVRWYEPGTKTPREVRVESDRSPTIGEAVPSGISTGEVYSSPPAVAVDFVPVQATNTYINWTIGFKNTKKLTVQWSATPNFATPVTVHTQNITDPNLQNQNALSWTYTTATDSQKAGYFRTALTGLDNSVTVSAPVYQGMAPTLMIVEPDTHAKWTAPWIPANVTHKIQRVNGSTGGTWAQVAQGTGSSVAIPSVPDGVYRYRVFEDKASTGWAIHAYSNTVLRDLRREVTEPVLRCYPNHYRGDITVAWQNFATTWSSAASGSIQIKEKNASTTLVDVSTGKASEYLFNPGNPTGTFTSFAFFGNESKTGMGSALAADKTYSISYTVTEAWGERTETVDCATSQDFTKGSSAQGIPNVNMINTNQQTRFEFDSRNIGLGIDGSASSKTAGAARATVKTELFRFTGNGPAGTLVSSVSNSLPSYASGSGKFTTTAIQNPVSGGKYYFKITVTPGTNAGTTRVVHIPYMYTTRDFTYNTNVAARMFPVIEGDTMSFYEVNANGAPSRFIRNTGLGWAPCSSMAADVSRTSIYCVFGGGLWKYDWASDGEAISKVQVGTHDWDKYRDVFFIQNFFGDDKPAILGVVGRTGLTSGTYAEGNMVAYQVDANGVPNNQRVVGVGWQNLLIQPIYDYNKPGDIGIFVAAHDHEMPPRIYPVANGGISTPVNWNVETDPTVIKAPNGWVRNAQSIAGVVHNSNNEPVLNFDMKQQGGTFSQGGEYTQVKFTDTSSGAPARFATKMVMVNPGSVVKPRRTKSPGNEIFIASNSVREPKTGNMPGQGDGHTVGSATLTDINGRAWTRPGGGIWTYSDVPEWTASTAVPIKTRVDRQQKGYLTDTNELLVKQANGNWARYGNIVDFDITGDILMTVNTGGILVIKDGTAAATRVATGVEKVTLSGDRYGYLKADGSYYVGSTRNAAAQFAGGNEEWLFGTGYKEIQVAGHYIAGILENTPTRMYYRTAKNEPLSYMTYVAPIAKLAISQERIGGIDWNGNVILSEWTRSNNFYSSSQLKLGPVQQFAASYMWQTDNHWAVGHWWNAYYKYGDFSARPFVQFTSGEGFIDYAVEDLNASSALSLGYDQASGIESNGVNTVKVRGWAFDPDAPHVPVSVGFNIVYDDGSKQTVAPKLAQLQRTDVAQVHSIAGPWHGFDETITLKAGRMAASIEPMAYRVGAPTFTYNPTSMGVKWFTFPSVSFQSLSNTNKCIDNVGGKGAPNDLVAIHDCNGSVAQIFNWDNGYLKVKSSNYLQCIDVPNGTSAVNAKLAFWNCNGNFWGQKFDYDPATKAIKNSMSGLCIDVPNNNMANGNRLQMFTCNGSPAQQFTFRKMQ